MKHELKINVEYFQAILNGDKTFEIRRNDRGFQKGDKVLLEEIFSHNGLYTRRRIKADISYVTNFEQKKNWVVFGIKNVELIK